MLPLFYMEAELQFPIIKKNLGNFVTNKQFDVEELLKALTSFKGAAKIASLNEIFENTVSIEVLIESHTKTPVKLNDKSISALLNNIEILSNIIEQKDINNLIYENETLSDITTTIKNIKSDINSVTADEKVASQPDPIKKPVPLSADLSMMELFRAESESQTSTLSEKLLELENNPEDPQLLENLMRAAHSFKGAARMVGIDHAVSIGHVMEDVFVAAQKNQLILSNENMDILLASVDLLSSMAQSTADDYETWCVEHNDEIKNANIAIKAILDGESEKVKVSADKIKTVHSDSSAAVTDTNANNVSDNNNVRVSTNNLNRLIGLSSEAQMESRWLQPYSVSLLQVKKQQTDLIKLMDTLRDHLVDLNANESIFDVINEAHQKADICRDLLTQRLTELENYDRRSSSLSHRLNNEILKIRMRPFSDGTKGFSRLVRDVSRSLNKEIDLRINGLNTQVDRDILDKLQAPLNHLLRNAIDHGIEDEQERLINKKPAKGTITLEASHNAGMLTIKVQDDGKGIDLDKLREKIIKKKLVSSDMAEKLSESELLDFLFLPNFSTRENVTEISGRGVGLDVVHTALQEMRGTIRATTQLGKGMTFLFQLPLTLSVIRALLVKINNETYAFPLAHINKTLKINAQQIEIMENRQYFTLGSQHIGVITAHQVLELNHQPHLNEDIPIVILGNRLNNYAVVVDEFLGERNLSVHTIDERLGKIQNVSSASLTEDGHPLLIFDVEDMIRSIDILLSDGRLRNIDKTQSSAKEPENSSKKRVLVVDDSITVRETERNLLESEGYQVEIAVDGMDGWNATRTNQYDLIISDIDMPRMNGFELVEQIKSDDRFKNIPVIIVSYKDREEDRLRGLDVGADYYLTKGSFHDDTFIEAVSDLIGEA